MKIFILISSTFFLASCSNPVPKSDNNSLKVSDTNIVNETQKVIHEDIENLDSIKNIIQLIKQKSKIKNADTIKYKFQLEDVGTEGNEGIAYYFNDSLRKAEIEIYTSMWRYHIQYNFSEKKINVVETTYNISNGSSNKVEKIKQTDYSIDFNGKLIGLAGKDRVDIFQDFKNAIPFELK